MLLLLMLGLSVANGQTGLAVPGEPFSDTTRFNTAGYGNWREGTTSSPRMEVGIGMLMPIGADLKSLGTEGQEKRDALMVAAYMINNDPQYNVKLTYDYNNDLLDTALDDLFPEVSQGDSMGTDGKFANPDDFANQMSSSDLCTNARQLCQNTNIKAIVGGYRSSRSIGMAHCCMSKDGLPHVSPGSTSAYLTKNRPYPGGSDAQVAKSADGGYFPYFFRSVPNDDYQGVALMQMAMQQGFTDVGVIYTDDAYSRGMAEAFIKEWTDAGFTVTPAGGVNMGYVDQGDVIAPQNQGKTNAQMAAERQFNEGTSSVTILTTVSHDTDALMESFGNLGMTGDGWVFLGADGATSTDYSTGHLQDAYLGMAGTTALLPTQTTLYTEFVYAWTRMRDASGTAADIAAGIPAAAKNIRQVPWQGKNNDMVGAFTAQTYDAVAAIAMAATLWLQDYPECGGVDPTGTSTQCCDTDPQYSTETWFCATMFDREEMRKRLEAGVTFRALSGQDPCPAHLAGNQVKSCLTLFQQDANNAQRGQDGKAMYSIVNAQGDTWAILGTWTSGVLLALEHSIEWPGGKTTPPSQDRPVDPLAAGSTDDSGDMPGWIVPMVVILVIVVLGLALCMCYIIKREKQGMPVFDSPGAEA